MKRLSVSALLATVALSGLFAMSACGVVEGDEDVVAQVDDLGRDYGGKYRLCRDIETALRGQEVAAWWVRDYEDRLVAIKFSGRVQCVDSVSVVRQVGVIPGLEGEPACKFCGTPLPAAELIEGPEDTFNDKMGKPTPQ